MTPVIMMFMDCIADFSAFGKHNFYNMTTQPLNVLAASEWQKREPDPEASDVDHEAGPYHADRESALAKCSIFIIYQASTR